MRHINKNYPVDSVRILDFPIKFIVQPPTFATVSEAYAYFTRHAEQYPQPDYDDDSDDLPQFVTDPDQLLSDGLFPLSDFSSALSSSADSAALHGSVREQAAGMSDDDGQPRNPEERESEPASD